YGKMIKGEVWEANDKCWRALVFTLGLARGFHSLKAIIEAHRRGLIRGLKYQLAKPVEDALKILSEPEGASECSVLKLFIIGDEATPLGRGILLTPFSVEEFIDNPLLNALIRAGEIRRDLEEVLKAWEEKQMVDLIEEIYALGLSILTAYAVKRGDIKDEDLAGKALEVADWGIGSIMHPIFIVSAVSMLSPLSKYSPNTWASILNTATKLLANTDGLEHICKFISGLLYEFDKLSDSGKAYAISAAAIVLRAPPLLTDKVCLRFMDLLNKARGLRSEALRLSSQAPVLHTLASSGLDCCVDVVGEVENLINRFEEVEKSDEARDVWLDDDQLREYLRSQLPCLKPEAALIIHIKNVLSLLYFTSGKISLDRGEFDEAVKYFERCRDINQRLRSWNKYVVSRCFIVRAKALKASSLNELVSVTKEFGDVFREAEEKLGLRADEITNRGYALFNYLIHLGLSGNTQMARELYKRHSILLHFLPSIASVTGLLMLRYLGVVDEVPSTNDIVNAMNVHKFMRPALKITLGLNVNCEEECKEVEDKDEGNLCIGICNGLQLAIRGDETAREELLNRLKTRFEDSIVDELGRKYGPGALVQALAPATSNGGLVLALRALLNNDLEAVKAIAEHWELTRPGTLVSKLFGSLREAVERNDEEGIRLALAKLFYRHY
ncbi:MAG: hypothetical protein ACP5H6_10685, partial [Caldivirga sp.]